MTTGTPGRTRRGWWWCAPAGRGDVVLALVVGAIQLAGTHYAARHQPGARPLDALGLGLLAAGPVALLARRRSPVAVLAVTFAVTLTYHLLDYPMGPVFVSLIVAFFTTVLAGHRLVAWGSIAAGYLSFLGLRPLLGWAPAPQLGPAIGLAAWLLVLVTVAEVVRTRRERAAEAERTRVEEALRRASDERLRIARELHDVVAHSISLINVQAGVALHLMDERPGEPLDDRSAQARAALVAIKQASKDALGELRATLGVLRRVDEASPRSPAPSLARLDELTSGAAAAGIEVRAEVDGDPRPLPAGVDRAAFRIVQEALTNVARHAGPTTATVRVAYGDRALTVQVDDDGHGTTAHEPAGGGNGIPGMRERAAALGGQLEAGPRPGGGFRVLARLPLDGKR